MNEYLLKLKNYLQDLCSLLLLNKDALLNEGLPNIRFKSKALDNSLNRQHCTKWAILREDDESCLRWDFYDNNTDKRPENRYKASSSDLEFILEDEKTFLRDPDLRRRFFDFKYNLLNLLSDKKTFTPHLFASTASNSLSQSEVEKLFQIEHKMINEISQWHEITLKTLIKNSKLTGDLIDISKNPLWNALHLPSTLEKALGRKFIREGSGGIFRLIALSSLISEEEKTARANQYFLNLRKILPEDSAFEIITSFMCGLNTSPMHLEFYEHKSLLLNLNSSEEKELLKLIDDDDTEINKYRKGLTETMNDILDEIQFNYPVRERNSELLNNELQKENIPEKAQTTKEELTIPSILNNSNGEKSDLEVNAEKISVSNWSDISISCTMQTITIRAEGGEMKRIRKNGKKYWNLIYALSHTEGVLSVHQCLKAGFNNMDTVKKQIQDLNELIKDKVHSQQPDPPIKCSKSTGIEARFMVKESKEKGKRRESSYDDNIKYSKK